MLQESLLEDREYIIFENDNPMINFCIVLYIMNITMSAFYVLYNMLYK